MITQLAFLEFNSEECMSTFEMLSIATVANGKIEDARALLDAALEHRAKNSTQITLMKEGQAACVGNVFMTSVALLNLYISSDEVESGYSFLQNLSRCFVASQMSDKDRLMEMIGPARQLASFFIEFDDLGACEGILSSWLSKSESLLGSTHPFVLQLMCVCIRNLFFSCTSHFYRSGLI